MKRHITAVCRRIVSDVKEYGMAVVIFIVYAVVVNLIFYAFCPLVIFSGFPCPGCGVTRAAVCLATGRFWQAWQLQPVVFAIMLTAVYFCVNRYLLGRRAAGIKWMIAAVFVLLIGVYLIRMYRYFPDRAPYVYHEDNMLAHMLPFYSEILYQAGKL